VMYVLKLRTSKVPVRAQVTEEWPQVSAGQRPPPLPQVV
jgi:hypothetical protein